MKRRLLVIVFCIVFVLSCLLVAINVGAASGNRQRGIFGDGATVMVKKMSKKKERRHIRRHKGFGMSGEEETQKRWSLLRKRPK